MDWSNERYVRVYTRDTTTWKLMDWRGRTVLSLLIRKVDRAGVLDVGHDGVLGLAAVLELPIEIVEAGIGQLTAARGGTPTVIDTGTAYALPNFLEAQEAPQSDPQRKRESRARRREVAVAASRNILPTTDTDRIGHETGRVRDENTESVTPIRSDPVPTRSQDPPPARAIQPSTDPIPQPYSTMPTLAERTAVREKLRSDLQVARTRAAAARDVAIKPLLAFDRGIDSDLTDRISRASTTAALQLLADQAKHAIAMAELEVTHGHKSFEWFTGAIFSGGNFARLAGKTPDDVKRAAAADTTKATLDRARAAKAEPTSAPRPVFVEPPVMVDEEQRAEAGRIAREAMENLFGSARAPPRSADPTNTDTDDEQPEHDEATST